MTAINSEEISGTITITLEPQDKGQYLCHLSSSLGDRPTDEIQCYGQNKEHAIAIALEKLARGYRQIAEEQQNIDWEDRSYSEFDEPILKQYHVILHYERIAEEESKFEALQNTMLGNTVVEDATITLVEIEPDLPVKL